MVHPGPVATGGGEAQKTPDRANAVKAEEGA